MPQPAADDLPRLIAEAALPLPPPGEPGFADWADRLAGARVVCMGEASHGTAEFYRARAALTRRLIERQGVTAVAFEADWPEAGVGPDEVDTSALLGYRLEIQPMVRSLTYVYGDGNSSGPTESLGGPHPDGDIRWTYTRAGAMSTRLDTTYGARFRLQGGAWMTIPDTVTIQGTPVTLTVREAASRLYTS